MKKGLNIDLTKLLKSDIKNHYDIEVFLADRLRNAESNERKNLYKTVYNELFNRVPKHPQLIDKKTSDKRLKRVASEMILINSFISKKTVFLEIGAGDCALSKEVSKVVQKVVSIDVSPEIFNNLKLPNNVQTKLTDGINIPAKCNTIDIVYSNQLMEHLHPDDALENVKNIYISLRKNGKYICITPNKFNGPHDVSKFFDLEPKGLHLKEYTNKELIKIFKNAGFSKLKTYFYIRDELFNCPIFIVLFLEMVLLLLHSSLRIYFAKLMPFRELLGIRMVAIK